VFPLCAPQHIVHRLLTIQLGRVERKNKWRWFVELTVISYSNWWITHNLSMGEYVKAGGLARTLQMFKYRRQKSQWRFPKKIVTLDLMFNLHGTKSFFGKLIVVQALHSAVESILIPHSLSVNHYSIFPSMVRSFKPIFPSACASKRLSDMVFACVLAMCLYFLLFPVKKTARFCEN
jgi:hypothetical protein